MERQLANTFTEQEPGLKNITVTAMDPGGMPDSRCMAGDSIPASWKFLMRYVLAPLQPVLKHVVPTLRTATSAGVDLVELAVGPGASGKQGYFTMLNSDKSSKESYDEEKQKILWGKSLEWANLSSEDTVLKI